MYEKAAVETEGVDAPEALDEALEGEHAEKISSGEDSNRAHPHPLPLRQTLELVQVLVVEQPVVEGPHEALQ